MQGIKLNQQVEIDYSQLFKDQKDVIHVLLVDDDSGLLEISKNILTTETNFKIDTALDVEDAFKKIKNQSFDVIVSDYDMPLKNGLQFLQELRLNRIDTPFILFTGKGREEVSIKALNLGADGYIDKHGDPETIYGELKHKIIQLSNQHRFKEKHLLLVDQYEQFFSNIPSAVAVYEAINDGEDFIFKDFNPVAEKLENLNKESVLGKSVFDVFSGAREFGIFEVFQRVWKTGKTEHFPAAFYHDQRDSGSWRENWIIKLPNGNIAAIYNNLTESKRTEAALVESQKKFKFLFEANPDPSIFFDPKFQVIEANSRFSQIFGYSLEEIKGKDMADLLSPEHSKQEIKIIKQKIKKGLIELVTTIRRKDDVSIPLLVSGNPVLSDKKLFGSIFVFKDISDIITVQDELSKALSKTQQLNEKLKVVGSLTRHDVCNKLTVVNSYSYLIKKKCVDNPEIAEYLAKIEHSILDSLKIFDFAKTYEQIGVEELVNIDVENSVCEAVGMFSELPLKVINECHGLIVKSDSLLRQLIYNLLDNTRKHGKKATYAKISYKKTTKQVILTYEDDGVGISSENKMHLFKQGFSTGNSTGFGLFLSKKMLEVYGWTITEAGEPGKGAKFVINIPI
ncbi:MAG: response regulator [Candidatus Bathyarchaeia archaeon]